MADWAAIALRFAVYADLMALAGLAVGGGLHWPARAGRRLLAGLAAIGLALTAAQLATTIHALTGGETDAEMLSFLLLETPMGVSSLARSGLLAALALGLGSGRVRAILAFAALASLAWSGHAAASEGALGWLHRGSDIVHLAAGALWIGALVTLLRALLGSAREPESAGQLAAALRRFARVGTLVVVLLAATGIVNLVAIVGIADLRALSGSDYGRLLGLKLLLFVAMLGLAGLNRWRLAPALGRSEDGGRAALRRSIGTETALAFAILALVAILGTLSPLGDA